MLRGCLDEVSRYRIAGWAQDESRPHQPVALLIIDNGHLLTRVVANRYRPDLEAHGIGTGRHGFELTLDGGLPRFERHVIQVVRERDFAELPASPVIIESSDAFDSSARSCLRSALDSLDDKSEIDEAISCLKDEIDRLALRRQSNSQGRLSRRRALVIDSIMPALCRDAGSNSIISHMQSLVRLGYQVSFVANNCTSLPPPISNIDWLTRPDVRSVEEVLALEENNLDLIYLHRFDAALRYTNLVRSYHQRARLIYGLADLHYLRMARRGFIERELSILQQARKVREAELAAARAADAVVTHSTAEAKILRDAHVSHVIVAPWEVKAKKIISKNKADTIGFIGHFGHAPNVDAARRLSFEIMPRLRELRPNIICLIAGSLMPAYMRNWDAPGVEFCGMIDDLQSFFNRVSITVAPMAYGAGVKGKVLDSIAAGIPCVGTTIAAEGLDWPSSMTECIARDNDGLVEAVIKLLDDPTLYRRVAHAGRMMVRRHWSARAVDRALAKLG